MTAHHRNATAPLDPARALMIRAMISHISVHLDPGTARTCTIAGHLLAQIEAAYPGTIRVQDQHMTLTLFGVSASALSSTVALLREWQKAARMQLETGGR